ncbi:hypothetical protein GYMLUDRAFT_59373 [Collybiopsis luxurians FD-317 M1]|uniref:Unplaced genomic scaffold GYMLUscaffold_26, whole genome shotgun sequence n=1 Tax=Collybiopsis luxurians FD-317 M1 TaxID=944289 RepID=A0A0D0BY04_9AGAR|nr:hypothetical protein GYMLUDRAFT_59373 [Collybiopsis luxurians FD-317 M1]
MFVVLDVTGIHTVALRLLCSHLWPATVGQSRTAALSKLLEHFQLLSFMSKVSVEEMYHRLEHLTDNTGTAVPSSWIWVGHNPGGVAVASDGALVVQCPACPYPSINLPSGWKSAPAERKWIYKLFTAMDGNMKAMQLNASSEACNPGLTAGHAYFINPTTYHIHVEMFNKCFPNPTSSCNNHKVVSGAGSHAREQNCTIGSVFSVFCAHHDCFQPQGTTDLRFSEQYVCFKVNFCLY